MQVEKAEPTEAVKELIKTWEEEDQKWLTAKVPEGLHTVAARYGRKLFTIVMQAGSANYAITTLLTNIPASEGKKMVVMLSRVMDEFCQGTLKAGGFTIEQFKECRLDVERVVELAQGGKPAGNVSPGGIILDS